MKQGGLIFAGFVLMLTSIAVPLTAEPGSVNYQTYIVENFDSPQASEWTWQAVGSKFVTDEFPVLKYFDGMPHALRVMQADPDTKYGFMGMQVKFNRKGDNWVDIFPIKSGDGGEKPYEIPFKGVVSRLDMWVWGAGYLYDVEILVRDCNGRVHTLPLGSVNFQGWKNLAVTVPTNIPQQSRYLGSTSHMSFVAFRVRTRPSERVDDFYIFFDQFKALTDVYSDSYDGYELVDAHFQGNGNKETGK